MEIKNRTWWVLALILVALVALFYFFFELTYDAMKSFSIIGGVASIVGIIVTMIQVSSAINKTEAVKKEVEKNSNEIRSSQSLASFSSESEKVRSIIGALSSKEFKFLSWRIGELKDFLVRNKNNSMVSKNEAWNGSIDNLIVSLGVDIQNLVKKFQSRDYVLDVDAIAEHLDQVATLLAEVNGSLENERYEQAKSN